MSNLLQSIATCMNEADVHGYAGVLYLYHPSSTQVIVQWTGQGVRQKGKVEAEQYLLGLVSECDIGGSRSANNGKRQDRIPVGVNNSDESATTSPSAADRKADRKGSAAVTECGVKSLVSSDAESVTEGAREVEASDSAATDADPDWTELEAVSSKRISAVDNIVWLSDIKMEEGEQDLPTDFEVGVDVEAASLDFAPTHPEDDIMKTMPELDTEMYNSETGEPSGQSEASHRALPTKSSSSAAVYGQQRSNRRRQLPHQCVICQQSFSTINHLLAHMQTHAKFQLYSCVLCHMSFGTKAQLKSHAVSHTTGTGAAVREKSAALHQCSLCSKTFDRKCLLQIHQRVHQRILTRDQTFPCLICGKVFASEKALGGHQRLHAEDKAHPCSMCSQAFPSSSQLRNHMRCHEPENPNQCTICSKIFARTTTRCIHTATLTNGVHFCSNCSRAFDNIDELLQHQQTHNKAAALSPQLTPRLGSRQIFDTGNVFHQCVLCNKTYISSSALLDHQRTHTDTERCAADGGGGDDRPYQCTFCSKTFTRKNVLIIHERIHTHTEQSVLHAV